MKILSLIFLLIGCFLCVTTTFVWAGHGIYELIKTDQDFWEVLLFNGGMWVFQLGIGIVSLFSSFYFQVK